MCVSSIIVASFLSCFSKKDTPSFGLGPTEYYNRLFKRYEVFFGRLEFFLSLFLQKDTISFRKKS